MHEDKEACTIDSVVFVVVVAAAAAAAAAADDDNDDYGEKEIVKFITYYFSSTCRFSTDIHLLKFQCLKNKVLHSNANNYDAQQM
jgi:hypothetical protein